MCGLAGFATLGSADRTARLLDEALTRLHHRGPDDRGSHHIQCGHAAVGLGHTRLSIIDLSSGGHQPMQTQDGRLSVVFNGEIYNYKELRAELAADGLSFRSESDTEVLLQGWIRWGKDVLPRLVGMFAFAIVDTRSRTLSLARDPFGIKPLFVARAAWGWCFASELPACVALRNSGAELNLQRTTDYLLHGDYDSSEDTFIAGIHHLAPGHLQTISLDDCSIVEHRRWWAPDIVQQGRPRLADAAEQLRALFIDSVRLHLRSDVPLGAALSGGIDSSAVVYAMRKLEPDAPLHTFSFIARGSMVSEENWIQAANAGVTATPHRVEIDPSEMARDLDDVILAQGEPFGSTSIYAQYRVFKLAREAGIKVTLDGQGADELLGGYIGYPGPRIQSLLDRGDIVGAWSFLKHWSQWPGRERDYAVRATVGQYLQGPVYQTLRRLKWRKAALMTPMWLDGEQLKERGVQLGFPRQLPDPWPRGRRMTAELALSATRRGLPALLRHADRNSMRFSIESRVPFLTQQLATFLFSLPEDYLVSPEGRTKHIFRIAMRGIVPDEILERRDKIGFATPERDWLLALSGQAREWLQDAQLVSFLRLPPMLREFDAMLAGQVPFSWQAWRWINFCRWYVRVLQPLSAR
ncbi:MAG: asparagine synthase (glutamine-hydrolyzing) [Betaproteobacteria bacterium]